MLRKGTFPTVNVLKEVLLRPGPNGVTADEMRDRLRLLLVIEEAEEQQVLELDNVDFQKIIQMLDKFRFGVVTKDLLETVDGIVGSGVGASGNGKPGYAARN
jgi:hypothetical protein